MPCRFRPIGIVAVCTQACTQSKRLLFRLLKHLFATLCCFVTSEPHLHGGYSQKLNDDRHVCLVSRSTFSVVIGKYHYNTAYNIQIGTFTRFVYLINSQSEYINKRKLED